jgi:hypothetical protein
MDKDLASHVVRVAFRSATQLSELLPLLENHCTESEYDTYEKAIADIVGRIGIDLVHRVYAAFPGLEQEFKNRLEKYRAVI